MRPIRVNVDFEEVLAKKPRKPSLLATVEFFALWVTERTLLAHRPYTIEYLEYISDKTGHMPLVVGKGDAEDWWGSLEDMALMQKLSSKTEFLKWWQSRWSLKARACHSWEEVVATITDGTWLVKKSDGMSGRGHLKLTATDLNLLRDRIEKNIADGAVVEPLYDRTEDISALWVPEENHFIYYQNLIDSRFQWRGCVINKMRMKSVPDRTLDWGKHLVDLQKDVAALGYTGPFSVDAFYYRTSARETFHPGSEMNPRKTMGWLAYQFWKKSKADFGSLQLFGSQLTEAQWEKLKGETEVLLLSPPDNPFTWIWVEADSKDELEKKIARFSTKLPAARGRGKA